MRFAVDNDMFRLTFTHTLPGKWVKSTTDGRWIWVENPMWQYVDHNHLISRAVRATIWKQVGTELTADGREVPTWRVLAEGWSYFSNQETIQFRKEEGRQRALDRVTPQVPAVVASACRAAYFNRPRGQEMAG